MKTQEEWQSYAARTAGRALDFDGATYSRKRDGARLQKQLNDVRRFMDRGQWWTLYELSTATGHPQTSVSARIRDLRKTNFGGHKVERRFVRAGLFEYRLILNPNPQPK